jgi:hypothetical protein
VGARGAACGCRDIRGLGAQGAAVSSRCLFARQVGPHPGAHWNPARVLSDNEPIHSSMSARTTSNKPSRVGKVAAAQSAAQRPPDTKRSSCMGCHAAWVTSRL